MGLFSKNKINTDCACAEQHKISDLKNPRFIVLGACCKKSQQTFENTRQAVLQMGLAGEVVNIGDNIEIAKYGVMQTPALVIDSKVVSYGKLLSVDEVKTLIEKAGIDK